MGVSRRGFGLGTCSLIDTAKESSKRDGPPLPHEVVDH